MMETIAVRDLTGARLRQVAEAREVVGVTNDRVLCAVLLPVEPRLVRQLVERNLSEIVHGVGLGEKELSSHGGVDLEGLTATGQRAAGVTPPKRITSVGIRELSARRISEAAEEKETLGITSNRELVAFLVPVSQRWVDQIIELNLSRMVKGIQLGETSAIVGDVYGLDDVAPGSHNDDETHDGARPASVSMTPSNQERFAVAAW